MLHIKRGDPEHANDIQQDCCAMVWVVPVEKNAAMARHTRVTGNEVIRISLRCNIM